MLKNNLNERCTLILKMLLLNDGYMSLQEIAEGTNVSKRSIYNDIYGMNEWLKDKNTPALEVVRGRGVQVPLASRARIEKLLEEERLKSEHIFSPAQRVKVLICYIIYSKQPLYVNYFIEYFRISRNTIFGDLRLVSTRLKEHNLELWYDSKSGYKVVGDMVRIRALFTLTFNDLKSLFESGILDFIDKEEVLGHLQKLKAIEKALGIEYVEGKLLSLGVLLSVIYAGGEQLHLPGLKREEISETKEYKLINQYFLDLPEEERFYLCLHMLGARLAFVDEEIFDRSANPAIYQLSFFLVSEFERIACVSFEDKEELQRALYTHISTSMYRYQHGVQIEDSMSEDIIREYPNLFEITKVVTKKLEQMIGLPIVDGEVALLALHFGSRLTRRESSANQLRVLIVCINGISTGNMLKQEIQQLLPRAVIVGVISKMEMLGGQEKYDLIISTVNIKSEVPVIVVRPILTNRDREQILSHKVVERSYSIGNKGFSLPLEEENLLLKLNLSKVRVIHEEVTWQKSIYLTGESLIREGSVEERYLDRIVEQIAKYGAYMFLTDEVVLAHAGPDDGVNHTDISLALFQQPILFPEGNKGRLIFVLATEDQKKHLNILNDIFKVVSSQRYVNQLLNMKSPEEILRYLNTVV